MNISTLDKNELLWEIVYVAHESGKSIHPFLSQNWLSIVVITFILILWFKLLLFIMVFKIWLFRWKLWFLKHWMLLSFFLFKIQSITESRNNETFRMNFFFCNFLSMLFHFSQLREQFFHLYLYHHHHHHLRMKYIFYVPFALMMIIIIMKTVCVCWLVVTLELLFCRWAEMIWEVGNNFLGIKIIGWIFW